MRYTYSDDEYGSDAMSSRRSTGVSTPFETGPTVTASGRQVKSRVGGMYGESMLTDQRKEFEKVAGEGHLTETSEDMPTTAPTGRGVRNSRSGRPIQAVKNKYTDGMDSDSDENQTSGKEWSGDEDEPDASEPDFDAEDEDDDNDEEMSDEGLEPDELLDDSNTQDSLVVQLRYRKSSEPVPMNERQQPLPGPQPQPQQPVNGELVNGVTRSEEALRPLQQPTEIYTQDTIEVAPRAKAVSGTHFRANGVENMGHHPPAPHQPQTQIPIQPLELS